MPGTLTGLSPMTALAFLPFALAIGVWVSWSDMKFMKIPNKAVLALGLVFLILGVLLIPFKAWLWAVGVGAAVLVAGFIANQISLMGAGDAKFAAVMAPFFAFGDIRFILGLFSACLLGAFASHRMSRMIPAVRTATEDWASWTHKDFPMGLALAGTLIFYLLAALKPLF